MGTPPAEPELRAKCHWSNGRVGSHNVASVTRSLYHLQTTWFHCEPSHRMITTNSSGTGTELPSDTNVKEVRSKKALFIPDIEQGFIKTHVSMAFKLATELGFTPTLTRLKKVVTCQIAVMDVHGPDTPTPRITFWTEAREESMPKTKVRSCETGQ